MQAYADIESHKVVGMPNIICLLSLPNTKIPFLGVNLHGIFVKAETPSHLDLPLHRTLIGAFTFIYCTIFLHTYINTHTWSKVMFRKIAAIAYGLTCSVYKQATCNHLRIHKCTHKHTHTYYTLHSNTRMI